VGQTPKPRPQPSKALPSKGSTDGEGGAGGGDQPVDFCAMTHRVAVLLSSEADVRLGDRVTLHLGAPPSVFVENIHVGSINDPLAQALGRCIVDGYGLSGQVDDIAIDGSRGHIVVSGRREGS